MLLQQAQFPQRYMPVRDSHVALSGALCMCTMVSPIVGVLWYETKGGVLEISCKVGSACRICQCFCIITLISWFSFKEKSITTTQWRSLGGGGILEGPLLITRIFFFFLQQNVDKTTIPNQFITKSVKKKWLHRRLVK